MSGDGEALDLGTAIVPLANPAINKEAVSVTNPDGTPDSDGIVDQVGDVINYEIAVSNAGFQDLTGVVVTDPLLGGNLSNPVESINNDGILERGETWTYTGSYTVQQSDIDSNGGGDGDIDNIATVDTDQTPPSSDSEEVLINLSSISGNVSEDIDNDDTGDVNLENVTVELLDDQGTVIRTTTTDTDGNYEFTDLEAGDYTVRQVNLGGYSDVSDTDPPNDNLISVTLPGDVDSTGNDFVDEQVGSISGQVTDENGNGLGGVTIELQLPDGTPVGSPITTNPDGTYEFTGVEPGNYNVIETNLPNYSDVSEVDGGDDMDNPDNEIVNNIPVTVDPGEADTGNDFVDRQQADLSVEKTVDNANPNVGEDITFTIELNNAGPNDATNVDLEDLLPDGLTFVSATPSEGTYDEVTGLWDVGTVENGDTETLEITATVDSAEAIENIAQVTASDQFDPDSTPGNDVPSEDDQDSATVSPEEVADLSVEKTVDNANPNVGDDITFTIELNNDGPNDATSVNVEDLLPDGLTFVSATASEGTYDEVTGLWDVGTVENGDTETLEITATVDSAEAIENIAQVTASDQFDPDSTPGNDVPSEDDQDSATVSPEEPTPNIIDGTSGMDMITGTAGDDIITGFEGRDELTGGGGDDIFVYTQLLDQRDDITDFQSGSDQLDFRILLGNESNFYDQFPEGTVQDAIDNSYINPVDLGAFGMDATWFQIDPDGNTGGLVPENIVVLNGVSSINPDGNVFNPNTDLIV
ncbi:MAG: DUF11 domain-containing protein [Okeania sp. SIO2C9]|uniref:SdrD B-like domain-containing protein n=1 Tax=Okeania sp. SIO2C9 TaxID=2607791 RepID=UPI0013C1104C|nr:SdrD B-like domain-containing protein [Okeania sp. SIO2C9]NEQ74935.1 DUF11 domain-containing protein [Okeania sp. SIO2C9]